MSALIGPGLPWPVVAAMALTANRHDSEDGCSHWQGPLSRDGYPQVRVLGKQYPAHRLTAALFYGPAAVHGKDVHHLCENKACVNPAHLVPLTGGEHALVHLGKLTATPPPRPADVVLFMADVVAAVKFGSTRRAPKKRAEVTP